MGWKMVYNSLDKNRENREKMLLTFAKNSIRSKPPPSFRAVYHNKNHVITNTEKASVEIQVFVFLHCRDRKRENKYYVFLLFFGLNLQRFQTFSLS